MTASRKILKLKKKKLIEYLHYVVFNEDKYA